MVSGKAFVGALLSVSALACQSQPYVFTQIADITGQQLFSIALNNEGTTIAGINAGGASRIDSWTRAGTQSTLLDMTGPFAALNGAIPVTVRERSPSARHWTMQRRGCLRTRVELSRPSLTTPAPIAAFLRQR